MCVDCQCTHKTQGVFLYPAYVYPGELPFLKFKRRQFERTAAAVDNFPEYYVALLRVRGDGEGMQRFLEFYGLRLRCAVCTGNMLPEECKSIKSFPSQSVILWADQPIR